MTLATSGFDGTIGLWDLNLGEEAGDVNSSEEKVVPTDQSLFLEGVDFRLNDRYMVTAGDDGRLRIFMVAVEELMELARSRFSRDFTEEQCQIYLHVPACEDGEK
jgi:WD40 repeat protein